MTIQQMLLGAGSAAEDRGTEDIITAGHEDYTWVGDTTTWVCPAGVTSISVVCIGAGARRGGNGSMHGGGGGGLGWKNNISVSPGTSYSVQVGESWENNNHGTDVNPSDTWFKDASGTIIVKGGAGNNQTGGSYTGDGGGNGGAGGTTYNSWGSFSRGAGGGAGGYGWINSANNTFYAGNGGAGADGAQSGSGGNQGSNGTNNAASGGNSMGISSSHSACVASGGGGGSHLYGTGGTLAGMKTSSANNQTSTLSGAGRQGTNGQGGDTGASGDFNANFDTHMGSNSGYPTSNNAFGGGHGAAAGTSCSTTASGIGGAIRIIWPGNTRTFPDNALQTT